MSFKEYELNEVLDFFNGKKRPKETGSIPVYGGNGIVDYCNDFNTEGENIIIGRVGAYCGNVNLYKDRCWISDNAILAKAKNGFDNTFMYYLLVNENLYNLRVGSSQPLITQSTIKKVKIAIPEYQEQKAIAKILSDLDEKIEINNKINKTLEEMAQAIFKQWFVDFEFPNEDGKPYKSSGGEMVESEFGVIPKGWKCKELREVIKFIKGKKPRVISDNVFENSEKYLTIDALNGKNIQFAINDRAVLANKQDVLMVMDGASSGTLYFGMGGIVGSTLSKISILSKEINEDILYYFLKINESNIKSHLTGSAIPHTDKEFVNRMAIYMPKDETLLIKSTKIFSDIRQEIIMNNEESNRLKILRDTLLPKLMSGETRVPLDN